MKVYISLFIIFLFGCSDTISPDDNPEDILLIYQKIYSEGQLIAGNDSLIIPLPIDHFDRFLFDRSDTSIYIWENLINNQEIKTIVISLNTIISSSIKGSTGFIHFYNVDISEQTDSLFINNSLKYNIAYNYNDGSVIINSPEGNTGSLSPGMIYEDSTKSLDSLSRPNWITEENIDLVYEYTHHQKVINYGFIDHSKIEIIKLQL